MQLQHTHTTDEISEAAARIKARCTPTRSPDWLTYTRANGLTLWPRSYGAPGVETDSSERDNQALEALAKWAHSLPSMDPRRAELLDLLTVPDTMVELMASAQWVDCACPIITTTHRFAAAAICTTLPDDLDLHSPWPCVLVEVPDRLLPITDPQDGHKTWVRYAMVRYVELEGQRRWCVTGMAAESSVILGSRLLSTEALLANHYERGANDIALSWPLDTETDRVIQCLNRLVTNLLVTASEPHWCQAIGKHPPGWTSGPRRIEGAPIHRRFMVARPTELDLRKEVKAYCEGGASRIATVQTLVRGHWHTVLHGPAKSLRRLQWFEPYWRGDLDAKIATPTLTVGV